MTVKKQTEREKAISQIRREIELKSHAIEQLAGERTGLRQALEILQSLEPRKTLIKTSDLASLLRQA